MNTISYEDFMHVDFTVVLHDLQLAGIGHREVGRQCNMNARMIDRISHGQEPRFKDGVALMRLHVNRFSVLPAPRVMVYRLVDPGGMFDKTRYAMHKRLPRRHP